MRSAAVNRRQKRYLFFSRTAHFTRNSNNTETTVALIDENSMPMHQTDGLLSLLVFVIVEKFIKCAILETGVDICWFCGKPSARYTRQLPRLLCKKKSQMIEATVMYFLILHLRIFGCTYPCKAL